MNIRNRVLNWKKIIKRLLKILYFFSEGSKPNTTKQHIAVEVGGALYSQQ